MTDFLSKWILIFTVSLTFTGDCFAQSPVTKPTLSITDCTQVQSPQNLSELLVRIKSALETGFLRRKNFYTEESLKHCFGGQKVTWSNNDANNKVGEVSGFGNLGLKPNKSVESRIG